MTPWDLIVWSLCAAVSIVILGIAVFIFTLLLNIARGKI